MPKFVIHRKVLFVFLLFEVSGPLSILVGDPCFRLLPELKFRVIVFLHLQLTCSCF